LLTPSTSGRSVPSLEPRPTIAISIAHPTD
jgi:hypothetical protein